MIPLVTDSSTVLYEVADGVATLTLNRPDRLNAWIPEMADRYYELMDRAIADPAVRVIVLTGAGRAFCAGADVGFLSEMPLPGTDRPQERFLTMDLPKPTIAAINGACVGIALIIVSTFDVRFAAAGAKLSTTFVRLGLTAEAGSAWILPRLVGHGNALDLMLSGRLFLAEEVKEMGLVNRVHPAEQLLPETLRYAREMAALCSPTAMAHIKKQIWSGWEKTFAQSEREAMGQVLDAVRGVDFKEGLASFAEKRPPRYGPLRTEL